MRPSAEREARRRELRRLDLERLDGEIRRVRADRHLSSIRKSAALVALESRRAALIKEARNRG